MKHTFGILSLVLGCFFVVASILAGDAGITTVSTGLAFVGVALLD